jgi:glycosyltransferase involved in cell wall biosynthesis
MTHIFLNGLGASAGAGLTYLHNVVPRLASMPEVRTTLAVQPRLRAQFSGLAKVKVLDTLVPAGTLRRFWFEQKDLPGLVRKSGADVLLSAGNFALRNSPVPQILLSGNSLYTSKDFFRDLRCRGEYGLWLDTLAKGYFARKSVQWADCTVAPSSAYADELRLWAGKNVMAIHHGFDADVFFADRTPLAQELQEKLAVPECLKLLFVSHYNYYRNFETLFRGVARLRDRTPERQVRLFLTCTLDDRKTPGAYKTAGAARLIDELGIREEVVELGAIPYQQLHHVYRACDVYVTAAYTETFAHPLVEAMACGLPVVASNLAVHREVCGAGASYFPAFSSLALANRLMKAADLSKGVPRDLALERFCWAKHLQSVLALAATLTSGKNGPLLTVEGANPMEYSNKDCRQNRPLQENVS